jgi:hypothetical protein
MRIESDLAAALNGRTRVGAEVGVRVARKVLDASKAQGDAAVKLIQAAAKIAQAQAKQSGLDILA